MSMKKLAAIAFVGISSTMFLCASDETKTKDSGCSSQCEQSVAAMTGCKSTSTTTTVLPVDQQAFCDKLNACCQAKFKAMSPEARVTAMETARDSKCDANHAVEMTCKKMAAKKAAGDQ